MNEEIEKFIFGRKKPEQPAQQEPSIPNSTTISKYPNLFFPQNQAARYHVESVLEDDGRFLSKQKFQQMLESLRQWQKNSMQVLNENIIRQKINQHRSNVAVDFGRSRHVPEAMLKWQEVLKKKPFKGYNKKIHARTGGLSAKGRAKFKREQGSNLKPPVTTKPSKLKRGSKAAKRRKSFCARSKGFKRDDGTYSEKAKAARRRWNC